MLRKAGRVLRRDLRPRPRKRIREAEVRWSVLTALEVVDIGLAELERTRSLRWLRLGYGERTQRLVKHSITAPNDCLLVEEICRRNPWHEIAAVRGRRGISSHDSNVAWKQGAHLRQICLGDNDISSGCVPIVLQAISKCR